MSAKQALKHLSQYLLDYEKQELTEYETLYFLNMLERKMPGGIK